MILALAYEGKNWFECVPMVDLVVNSAVVEATGMLPDYFRLGQHLCKFVQLTFIHLTII